MVRRARGLVVCIVLAAGVVAAPGGVRSAAAEDLPALASLDSTSTDARGKWLFVLPVVSYAPETRVALGATAGRSYQFSEHPASRPSLVMPVFLVTTRSQLMAWLLGDVWWGEDAWHLAGVVGYAKFPTQFYGVGDATDVGAKENVTPSTVRLSATVTRAIWRGLYVGPQVEWEHTRILDRDPAGQLANDGIAGAAGGGRCGLGLTASYDTRDALQYPTRGWFATGGITRSMDILGGDFTYTRTTVDLRRYLDLGGTRVLAIQTTATSLDHGTAPYAELVRLGLRGYYDTRYLESHGVLAQVELRTALSGRLGAVVFAGGSELAASRDGLRLDETRFAAGVGLRVRVGPDGPQRAHLRFDYGLGDDDSGFYVNFAEAF